MTATPTAPGATVMLEPPTGGRTFRAERSVRLGDVDPAGRMRLDATARHLQDIATDDAADCGLDGRFGWVVRRTMIDVAVPAQLDERLELSTFCTGIGRSWAERRTSIEGAAGARIDAVSLWIQIDVDTGRPARITDQFTTIYGAACAGRSVSSRLSLDGVADSAARSTWVVRRADLDPFDHVNNAANWAFVEELTTPGGLRWGRAEMEYLMPVRHGATLEARCLRLLDGEGFSAWLTDTDGVVFSAARWLPG